MTAEVATALAAAGPWAVVLFLGGTLLIVLGRLHLQNDAKNEKRADDNYLLARDAVDGIKRLAAAWEERNRRDARKP